MAKIVSALREVKRTNEVNSETEAQRSSSAATSFFGAIVILALIAGSCSLIWTAMNIR